MKKLLVFVLVLTSCEATTKSNDNTEDITYFKDSKSGLCFASISFVTYGFNKGVSISNVPCDSVQYLIK